MTKILSLTNLKLTKKEYTSWQGFEPALYILPVERTTLPTRFLTCDILEAKENDRSSPKLGHHQLSISNFEGGQDFGRITNLDWAPLEQFTVDFLVFW